MIAEMVPYTMRGDILPTGPIDFRYLLDAPAGKHGFAKVKNGHLYFENGQRVKFFGVDIAMAGTVPEKAAAEIVAERLARSGVNMVRLHMFDTYQTGSKSTSVIDYSTSSTELNQENIDRFDYFVAALKTRGIYVHIDLFTHRSFVAGDELDYPDPLVQRSPIKTIVFFNRRLIELQKAFIKNLLTHRNPYTNLRYVNDPAVVIVQLANENSLLWGTGKLRQTAPSYMQELDERWNRWLVKKYGTRESLDAAWTKNDGTKGLREHEDPCSGSVERPALMTEEAMVSHTDPYIKLARHADHIEFLLQLQNAYAAEMTQFLREIGVQCLVNISNHPRGSAELFSLANGEVMENNAYWNHPKDGYWPPVTFHHKELHATDPRDVSVHPYEWNPITRLSTGVVENKPFLVTEWNACYPTEFRGEAMFMMASYGCLNDWDGIILHAYTHKDNIEAMNGAMMDGYFESYNDPAIWGMFGSAASIFLRGLVKPANNTVDVCYTSEDMRFLHRDWMLPFGYLPFVSRVQASFAPTGDYRGQADLAVSSGFTASVDLWRAKHALVYSRSPYQDSFLKRVNREEFLRTHLHLNHMDQTGEFSLSTTEGVGAIPVGKVGDRFCIVTEPEVFEIEHQNYSRVVDTIMKRWGLIDEQTGLQSSEKIVSDTGEITYDFSNGQFSIVGSHVIAFAGKVNTTVDLHQFRFTSQNDKVAVIVISKEPESISQSKSLLVSIVGNCINQGMAWSGDVLLTQGTGPVMMDQIRGTLFVANNHAKCQAFALDLEGVRTQELKVTKAGNGFEISLDNSRPSLYYELTFDYE